jgi:hypothetical protein
VAYAGHAVLEFTEASINPPAIVYLSPTTAGKVTTVVPAVSGTNQKLRIGKVVFRLTGNYAIVALDIDKFPIPADGNP